MPRPPAGTAAGTRPGPPAILGVPVHYPLATKPQGRLGLGRRHPGSYAGLEFRSALSPPGTPLQASAVLRASNRRAHHLSSVSDYTFLATAVSGCQMLTPLKLHLVKLLISCMASHLQLILNPARPIETHRGGKSRFTIVRMEKNRLINNNMRINSVFYVLTPINLLLPYSVFYLCSLGLCET